MSTAMMTGVTPPNYVYVSAAFQCMPLRFVLIIPVPSPQENKVWYSLSKTLAERAAHEFAAANGIALKSCNPTYILGCVLAFGLRVCGVVNNALA